jgi:hypothetical protein
MHHHHPADSALTAGFIHGRAVAEDAARLTAEYGADAAMAAALRAAHSRARDNAIRFCHWREVERMVTLLAAPPPATTRH